MIKSCTSVSCALCVGIILSTTSHAQTPPPNADADTAADTSGALEEVVVTARRRTEDLQSTPISISAYTASALEARGVSNLAEIGSFTPNLQFARSTAQSGDRSTASVYIRGIGQSDFTLTTDPGVGIYLDGVYIARSMGSALDVLDIERVEVLRGPQGTLFGRNTIGGAISITSRKPDVSEVHGAMTVITGSFDRFDAKAHINVPLSETSAMTASLLRRSSDGYIDRPYLGDKTGGDDSWAGRVAFNWTPNDQFSLDFSADGTRIRENSCCGELVAAYPGIFAQYYNAVVAPPLEPQLGSLAYFDNGWLPTEDFQDNAGLDLEANLDLWGVSLTADWGFSESMSLRSITAYRTFDSVNGGDIDHTPLAVNHTPNIFDNEQFSQELQLQGDALDERLNWILGLYYFDESGFNQDAVSFSIVRLISGGYTEATSIASFAQGTYKWTDKFSVTAGVRWTRDEKSFLPEQYVVTNQAGVPSQVRSTPGNLVILQPGDLIVPAEEVSESLSDTTPYLNVALQATDDLMFYASYSEGFKSGGFVQRNFPDRLDVPRFEPETVEVFEIGGKYETPGRKLRLNAAVFNTDYSNLQVQVFDGIAPVTQNAAAARIRGFETELAYAPVDGLLLEIGVGYLDSEYTDIDPAATEVTLDKKLVNAPRWSVDTGLSYQFALGSTWTLRPRVDWSYRSTVYNDARNTTALIQPSYELLDAGLQFADTGDRWQINLIGHNITDERYIQAGFADEAVQSVGAATFGRPAEWELSLRFQF